MPPHMRQIMRSVPYPGRLKKIREDRKFHQFLEVFRKLQMNIPLVDAIEHMLAYGNF